MYSINMVIDWFDSTSSDFEIGTSYSTRTDAARAIHHIANQYETEGYRHDIFERRFYIIDDSGTDITLERKLRIDK